MEVLNKAGRSLSVRKSSGNEEDVADLRRGPWTEDEDLTLINHIGNYGEGSWNSLARNSGLKRTGKSCRLRWLNYLRPDVRRGNITLEEQLLILELHSQWGNQWSKIAQHLPGRTDNEIKNYWRTRVQKHVKQLECNDGSHQFKDEMKYLRMPRLVETIRESATAAGGNPFITSPGGSTIPAATAMYHPQQPLAVQSYTGTDHENSCTTASSSEYSNPFYIAHEVSDPKNNDYHPVPAAGYGNSFREEDQGNHQGQSGNFSYAGYYYHQLNYGMEFQAMDDHQQQNHHDSNDQIQHCWSEDGGGSSDSLWNNVFEDVNYWCLQKSVFNP